MKKQQKTVWLLFAVVIIWGLIGYTFYKRRYPTIPESKIHVVSKSTFKKINESKSFYKVNGEYRDPFLGKYPQKKKVVKRKIKKIEVRFPNIIYNGMVEGNNTASYILTINGQQEIVKLGEIFQEVTLKKANSIEAIVLFQGVKKNHFTRIMKRVKKIKASAMQYVLVIAVVIALLIFAFISLIFLHQKMTLKYRYSKEAIHNTQIGFEFLKIKESPYNIKTELPFWESPIAKTTFLKKNWGYL